MTRIPAPFDVNARYVARHGFLFNGEQIRAGDVFHWQAVGCTERKLKQLYLHGSISMVTPEVVAPIVGRKKTGPKPRATADRYWAEKKD